MNIDYVVIPVLLTVFAVLIVLASARRLHSLRTGNYSRRRKLSERVVLSIGCLLFAGVAGSSLFNAIALQLFWRSHPPLGRAVMVGRHSMYIHCSGSGSPTLVLETGLGADSLAWAALQPSFAQTTETCAYDRSGFGWSDARPQPRDADHIAAELHDLLLQVGLGGPVILMGHSIGGLYIRDYALHYPDEVKGVIFIDSSSPLQNKNPAFTKAGGLEPPDWLLRTAMIVGLPRVLGMCSGDEHDATYLLNKARAEHLCGMHYDAITAEANNFDRSSQETLGLGNFGELPVLVISHDPAKLLETKHSAADVARQEAWSTMQHDLLALSRNSQQIIAVNSTHQIMEDRPDLLKKEVPLFIQRVRGMNRVTKSDGTPDHE